MVKTEYNHNAIEKKWQQNWSKIGLYTPNLNDLKNKFYNLWMFPYPSAEGLHAGHAFASTGSDVIGRYMYMNGKNVFQPIGYDSFGIHSENFALKINDHPAKMIARTTKHYEQQMRSLGHAYDWNRTVTTSDSDYYRWTQWLFTQMFKAGLAYKKKAQVNWCPSCKTVLADEQVVTPAQAGKEPKSSEGETLKIAEGMQVCERCGTLVERKDLEQWFFKITDYANKLLEGLEKINWPEKIKTAQRNWIGRKEWIDIKYPIDGLDEEIVVSTTRPDTNFGATFIVMSPEHPFVARILTSEIKVGDKIKDNISKYVEDTKSKSDAERISEGREKTGIFTNVYAINNLNGNKMPIYITDFVLISVGTGVVVGVPGHDKRDFEFAKKFNLPIKRVVVGKDGDVSEIKRIEQVQEEEGTIINSEFLNGLDVHKATKKIMDYLEDKGWGKRVVRYHLRDWLISRQRYWGPPIPMVYCQVCAKNGQSWFTQERDRKTEVKMDLKSMEGWPASNICDSFAGWYPVLESDLPVSLPNIKDFKPEGTGKGPLAKHPEFYEVECPGCGKKAVRETDVSDTFLDSAWYFLRYPSVGLKQKFAKNQELPWDPQITNDWLPVDLYFGGAEHAVLHLMYARFVWKMLVDNGFVDKSLGYEPFPWFYAHGLMIKDGAKMSKSRGNVVNPDEYVEKYGADTLRLYLMFMGPMDGYPDFRDTGIEGMHKFVERIWAIFQNSQQFSKDQQITIKMHQTIKKVTEDIQLFKYNTAISAIMEYVNVLKVQTQNSIIKSQNHKLKSKDEDIADWVSVSSQYLKTLALLLAPFTPHLAEEVWQQMNPGSGSIHKQKWPSYDPKLVVEQKLTIPVQINGKLRATIEIDREKENDKDYVLSVSKGNKKIQKWLGQQKLKKEIYVPGRLVNFVI
ncbi:MAG: Leucine-tRNA ligase [Candidatus Woesebacteria bacterium GW2011_GWA1_39_21]|uniref:Leucine--tRNA ligase n=1 Tax=Candidatus Woesebacteria bacterium GW2011_GWA1_39_21 TaxID=1618550 RepID=A0A0G0RBX3_9BACT|nr:MAG: Leucine-tRNA ligase [Candidatus Woesebacteria bacterium GW2011_GWA1_39_21]